MSYTCTITPHTSTTTSIMSKAGYTYPTTNSSTSRMPHSCYFLPCATSNTSIDNHTLRSKGRIFTNTIGRVRANWQFTRELSLRLITDFQDTDAVPGETSLTDNEEIVFDVLVKYLWNPWTALYVGYTSSTREFQEPDPVDPIFLDLKDEGRQFFVKFSYLFQL